MFEWLIPGAHRQGRFDFKDKTVLITGASGGIGAGLAREAYARGARLILVARGVDRLKALAEELTASGPGHTPVFAHLDLAKPEKVEELVKLSHNGKIDCLINNGGISMRGSVMECDEDVARRIMEVNFFGQITVTRALLPFIPQDGAVVVISSIQGKIAIPYRSAYSASKHALQAFFDSLRTEERFGLQITVVSPGYVQTDIGSNSLDPSGKPTGITGSEIATGYPVDEASRCIMDAVERREADYMLAPFIHRSSVFLRYWWPSLFFYSVWKRQVMIAGREKMY